MQVSHGADLKESLIRYHLDSLTDYSSNVNIFFSDEADSLLKEIKKEDLSIYPDIEYRDLREKLYRKYGIDSSRIIVGNGSTEIIFSIMRLDQIQKVGIINPTFSEYERAATLSGKEVVDFYYKDDFSLDFEKINFKEIDLLIICNPNNPSGTLIHLEALLDKCKENDVILFVDETFMDFTGKDNYSLMNKLNEYENLFILKAVTKFYSLTGVRLGYGFSSFEIISNLWQIKEPWTINYLAEKMVDLIFDEIFEKKSVDFYQNEIKWYQEELSKIATIEFYDSTVNFFLIKIKNGLDSGRLKKRLIINQGILIRDCSTFKGLDGSYIRVNIKDRESNIKFLRALKEELANA